MNKREAGLLEARKIYGEEVEAALRDHLAIMGEELCTWLSDLYEPRRCICDNFDSDGNRVCLLPKDADGKPLCTGGGYYYSNSARDTEGFDIDVESTAQVLSFCSTSGLLDGYGSTEKMNMIFIVLPRRDMNKTLKDIRKICDNKVFVVASDVSKYAGGYGMVK